jgi:hypothetical protein
MGAYRAVNTTRLAGRVYDIEYFKSISLFMKDVTYCPVRNVYTPPELSTKDW